MFKTKWRIVTDKYCGFEVQYKRWWFPLWRQVGGVNTFSTVEAALVFLERVKKKVVYIEP